MKDDVILKPSLCCQKHINELLFTCYMCWFEWAGILYVCTMLVTLTEIYSPDFFFLFLFISVPSSHPKSLLHQKFIPGEGRFSSLSIGFLFIIYEALYHIVWRAFEITLVKWGYMNIYFFATQSLFNFFPFARIMHINQRHSTHNKTRAYNSAALSIASFLWCVFHKSIFFCLFLPWSQLGLDPIPATIGGDAGPTQKDRKLHSHSYPCKILTLQLTQTPSVRVSGLWDEAFLHK